MLIARSLYKHDFDRQMVNPSRNDNNSSSSTTSSLSGDKFVGSRVRSCSQSVAARGLVDLSSW
eukprot:11889395-Heterocapsa_arctica.AAC.1